MMAETLAGYKEILQKFIQLLSKVNRLHKMLNKNVRCIIFVIIMKSLLKIIPALLKIQRILLNSNGRKQH
jgi:hypothetical protein